MESTAVTTASISWAMSIGPTIIPSLIAGAIAVLVVLINRSTTINIHKEKFEFDKQLSHLKFDFDRKIALEKLAQERQQTAFKRKFELAEEVLSDAYRFRDLMIYVRNGVSFEGEGDTRQVAGAESDTVKRARTTYFVPLERLQKNAEFIGSMMPRRTACRAHFGEDAEKAFDAFHEAIQRVRVASNMLMDMAKHEDRADRDFDLFKELCNDIWEPMDKIRGENFIGQRIATGVALIEGFCRPALAGQIEK